jgi:survival-of-motor-neuron-related-splicing factor 30
VKEKWSKENHPAFQPGYRRPTVLQSPVEEPETPTTFAVNDTVLAKWKSGDKAFYPARITSITGSSSKPVYIVTFKSYATTETLSAHEIKPISNESRKRKADGSTPGTPTFPTIPPPNSNIISAAASIDPALASQAKKEPSKVSDGPARPAKVPRKVKANKELEAGKSKWQDFTTKGKLGKVAKKESMFRTPDGVNARGMVLFRVLGVSY